jgi:hypothetical protein
MKKGDRVYCKNSCIYSGDIIHREGNYYMIGFIGNNSIVICEIPNLHFSNYSLSNTWSYDMILLVMTIRFTKSLYFLNIFTVIVSIEN